MHIRTHFNKSLTHSYKEEKQLFANLYYHVRWCEKQNIEENYTILFIMMLLYCTLFLRFIKCKMYFSVRYDTKTSFGFHKYMKYFISWAKINFILERFRCHWLKCIMETNGKFMVDSKPFHQFTKWWIIEHFGDQFSWL